MQLKAVQNPDNRAEKKQGISNYRYVLCTLSLEYGKLHTKSHVTHTVLCILYACGKFATLLAIPKTVARIEMTGFYLLLGGTYTF